MLGKSDKLLFNGLVNGFGSGSGPTFLDTLNVLAGDTIDFTVGFGNNGTFLFDTTQLDADITFASAPSTIPEPTSLTLVGVGSLGLLVCVWLRRKNDTGAAHAV